MGGAGVLVRAATPDDVDAIIGVHIRGRSAYYGGVLPADELARDNQSLRDRRSQYASRIGAPGFSVLCAERADRVLGFALIGPCYYPDPHPATISELRLMFVDPDYHGHGIGGALQAAAVRTWQDAGVVSARLWVWEFNQQARGFYTRVGWQADGYCRPDDPRIGEHRMLGYRLAIPDGPLPSELLPAE
jgi:GNAT superfamily N-acetyltransferase